MTATLGRVLYLYTNRQNFGKVRQDENALWSLAPHDLSLALALVRRAPQRGVGPRRVLPRSRASRTSCSASSGFPSGVIAHLHVSWLDPHKRRMLTVVGTEAMAVFDDTEADRKVTVYEKRSWPARFETWGEFQALQSGDTHIPRIPADEPLQLEMRAFVEAVRTGTTPIASGAEGLAVVETLAALQRSLDDGGRPVVLDGVSPCVGANVVIYPGTVIGAGVRIGDNAVVGKQPALGRSSTARREPLPPLVIGDGATIATGAVVSAGRHARRRRPSSATWRRSASACTVGEGSVVGRGVCVENDTRHRRALPHPVERVHHGVLPARGRRLRRALRGHDERQLHGPHRGAGWP